MDSALCPGARTLSLLGSLDTATLSGAASLADYTQATSEERHLNSSVMLSDMREQRLRGSFLFDGGASVGNTPKCRQQARMGWLAESEHTEIDAHKVLSRNHH